MSYIKKQYNLFNQNKRTLGLSHYKIKNKFQLWNHKYWLIPFYFQQLDQNSHLAFWTTFLTPPPDTRIPWPPDVRRDKQLTKLQTNKIWLVSIKYLFWFGHKDNLAKSLNAESILIFCHYMITLNIFNSALKY